MSAQDVNQIAKPNLRILISSTHNPWLNLATEEWIFNSLDANTQTLFLWRNQDTVVIGRNQNPWSECNLSRMEIEKVSLARRTSGGGAVFHDLGNTCFTFLSPKAGYDRAQNTGILIRALSRLGITAEASGRNDLVISAQTLESRGLLDIQSEELPAPRKVSGSAFRETQKKAFHHGTFLIATDLSRLGNYLTPHPKKLQSKGRASVRGRVMNLSELEPSITHEKLVTAVIEAFQEFHQATTVPEILDSSSLSEISELSTIFERFSSWEWRFGHAPQFSQTFAEYFKFGMFELHLNSDQGLITSAKAFSDALMDDMTLVISKMETELVGKRFSRDGLNAAFEPLFREFPAVQAELDDILSWLAREVEN